MNTRVREIKSQDKQLTFVVERNESGDLIIGFEGFPWRTHADILLLAIHGSPEEFVQHSIAQLENDELPVAILQERGRAVDMWIEESPNRQTWPEEVDGVTLELRYWSGKPYLPKN